MPQIANQDYFIISDPLSDSNTVSDTPVGEKENVELTQEELQTLVGYLLY